VSRSIKGFMILVAIMGGLSAYAWWYYNRAELQDPAYERSIPERAQQLRQKTNDPMKQFEKKMEQRIEDAGSRGIELKGSPTPVPAEIRIPPENLPEININPESSPPAN